MTLVIGMMADSKSAVTPNDPDTSSILLSADTLASYVAPSAITLPLQIPATSPYQSKIYPLPHGFYAGFCDDYAVSHHVAAVLYVGLQKLDPSLPAFRSEARKAVAKAFELTFLMLRPQYLTTWGVSEDEFLHDSTLAPSLKQELVSRLNEEWNQLPAQLIVAGQTRNGPLLVNAFTGGGAPWVKETTAYFAIGSPQESALSWLRFRKQHNALSVQRSFFHMFEAQQFCQSDPTVGRRLQAVLLQPNESPVVLKGRGTLLDTWKAEFGLRSTDKLDMGEYQASFETAFQIKLTPMLSISQRSVGQP
jgi:hypothetical protein